MNDEVSFLPPYISTRASVQVLSGFFFLSAAICWTAVGVDWAQIQVAGQLRAGELVPPEVRLAHARTASMTGAFQLVTTFATAIVFMAWLHRARVNVRALGARKMRFRREWTVLGFLIPITNALRPYQVMREVWMASDPSTGNPLGWKTVRVPRLLVCWWLTFVGFMALTMLSWLLLDGGNTAGQLRMAHSLGLGADVLGGISASLGFFVVSAISHAQEEKHGIWGPGGAPGDLNVDSRDAVA